MRGAREDGSLLRRSARSRERGLGARLERIADRWSRDFSTRIEEYSFLGDHPLRNGRSPRLGERLEVTQHRVTLHNFPDSLNGLRIVQLTDIHHGLFLPLHAVMEAVELVNRLEPDVVALTGDFVTYSRAYIEPVAEILGRIHARYGVYAVLGNHDFRVGPELVARALRRQGVDVLRNRHVILRRRADSVALAGIDDFRYQADLPRALHGIRAGVATILLSHNPKIIRRASQHPVSLVLSGHTHGGQVKLPVVGSILGGPPEKKRFTAGWDRLGVTKIYVSRGIGTVVLPLRYKCPAEIPQFHLYSRPKPPIPHS